MAGGPEPVTGIGMTTMPSADDHPDVIAKPPGIVAGFLAVGLAIETAWPSSVLPQTAQYVAGGAVFAAGLALVTWAMSRFRSAGTNIPTSLPATAFVTDGPYRLTRNPIYVAMALGVIGIALAVDSLWLLGLAIPLMAVIHFGVVRREERYLEKKFGDVYRGYKASVRRWI